MAKSGVQFDGSGWLAGAPKFYERKGKFTENFLVATLVFSSQKRKLEDGKWRSSDEFQTYYVDVRGKAAEWLKKEMEDPTRAWKSGDYVSVKGHIVPIRIEIPETEAGGVSTLPKAETRVNGATRYVLRVYTRADLNNYSAYERTRLNRAAASNSEKTSNSEETQL